MYEDAMTEVHLLDGRIINVWITRGNIQMSLGGEVRELKISEVWDTAALKARAAAYEEFVSGLKETIELHPSHWEFHINLGLDVLSIAIKGVK